MKFRGGPAAVIGDGDPDAKADHLRGIPSREDHGCSADPEARRPVSANYFYGLDGKGSCKPLLRLQDPFFAPETKKKKGTGK